MRRSRSASRPVSMPWAVGSPWMRSVPKPADRLPVQAQPPPARSPAHSRQQRRGGLPAAPMRGEVAGRSRPRSGDAADPHPVHRAGLRQQHVHPPRVSRPGRPAAKSSSTISATANWLVALDRQSLQPQASRARARVRPRCTGRRHAAQLQPGDAADRVAGGQHHLPRAGGADPRLGQPVEGQLLDSSRPPARTRRGAEQPDAAARRVDRLGGAVGKGGGGAEQGAEAGDGGQRIRRRYRRGAGAGGAASGSGRAELSAACVGCAAAGGSSGAGLGCARAARPDEADHQCRAENPPHAASSVRSATIGSPRPPRAMVALRMTARHGHPADAGRPRHPAGAGPALVTPRVTARHRHPAGGGVTSARGAIAAARRRPPWRTRPDAPTFAA